MKFIPRLFICVASLLLVVSCENGSNAKVSELEGKIVSLEQEVAKFSLLESKIIALEQSASFNELVNSFEHTAFLTPGANGYTLVRSDLGMLTVSIADIQVYASGSKVTLQFGNLTSATIDGLKTKIEWGPMGEDGSPNNDKVKSRDVTFNDSLITGSWTNSKIILEGIPPNELGFIRLRDVGHQGVKMRR